jgi:hypothetical protein
MPIPELNANGHLPRAAGGWAASDETGIVLHLRVSGNPKPGDVSQAPKGRQETTAFDTSKSHPRTTISTVLPMNGFNSGNGLCPSRAACEDEWVWPSRNQLLRQGRFIWPGERW